MQQVEVTFQPVEKEYLYHKIADAIYSYIKHKGMKAGDKLPSERDMAEMFQSSRNSVREALRILIEIDVLEVKQGRGTFIKEQGDPKNNLQLNIRNCKFEELLALKNIVERQAIQDAISFGSAEDKSKLVDMAKEMMEMAKKDVYSNPLDLKFHRKILEMSNNTVYVELVSSIRENNFARLLDLYDNDGRIWIGEVPLHYELALAIQKNDTEKALATMDELDRNVAKVEQMILSKAPANENAS